MILGWLLDGPVHGYKLKKGPMAKMFSEFGINDNQLYPALAKLEGQGFIEKAIERRDGSPSRNVYAITDSGRREFMEWLRSSEGEKRTFRYDFFRKDDFFIRCNFISHLEKEEALDKVDRQARSVEETIGDLKAAGDDMRRRGVDPLHVKILEYGIQSQETRRRWLDEFRDTLSARKRGERQQQNGNHRGAETQRETTK
jgi:DNA-binding PadR family transcriptional regulator